MVQLPIRQANNFDLLRILFAWFVIVSHAYVLNGDGATDPLFVATNSTFLFSFIGVKGFFIISGYLIFKSMMVSTSIFEYLVKRVLRIFPALAVVLIITLVAVYFVLKYCGFDCQHESKYAGMGKGQKLVAARLRLRQLCPTCDNRGAKGQI